MSLPLAPIPASRQLERGQSAPGRNLVEYVLVVFGDVFDGVAADGEVDRWLIGVGELDENPTELGGIAFLGVVHVGHRPTEGVGGGGVVGNGRSAAMAEDGSRKSVRK
jgi:hypothetical protein